MCTEPRWSFSFPAAVGFAHAPCLLCVHHPRACVLLRTEAQKPSLVEHREAAKAKWELQVCSDGIIHDHARKRLIFLLEKEINE